MKNLLDQIVIKRRDLLVEKEDVTKILEIVKGVCNIPIIHGLDVGKAEYNKYDNRWYVKFNASDEQWVAISAKIKRSIENDVYIFRKGYFKI